MTTCARGVWESIASIVDNGKNNSFEGLSAKCWSHIQFVYNIAIKRNTLSVKTCKQRNNRQHFWFILLCSFVDADQFQHRSLPRSFNRVARVMLFLSLPSRFLSPSSSVLCKLRSHRQVGWDCIHTGTATVVIVCNLIKINDDSPLHDTPLAVGDIVLSINSAATINALQTANLIKRSGLKVAITTMSEPSALKIITVGLSMLSPQRSIPGSGIDLKRMASSKFNSCTLIDVLTLSIPPSVGQR